MSSSRSQTVIQEPVPLGPVASTNLRENLHVPTQLRPISQETTYTDRTSRRGSLEENPPHLAPGEQPQIMTATPLNLGPQVPTPPPSPPLLERKGGFKKWFGLVVIGAASSMVILMIVSIVLLVAFSTKSHFSAIDVQASVPVWNGSEVPVLIIPRPTLGRRRGWNSTYPDIMADIAMPHQHPAVPISTFTVSGGVAVTATSEQASREDDSMAILQNIMIATTTVISTATIHSTVLMTPTSAVTKTITAAPLDGQPSQKSPTDPPQASVTVDLQLTVKNSGGVPSKREPVFWRTLSAAPLAGLGLACFQSF
ncbi:hypothetical protein BKA64DRAFT_14175 [Cadophora sp. MPI-SDFR-AT-0126]|nr:hypothetical protein BKA64DRAFT_14175 [Leotiomycetes sp. MPI-SDFR-AT-0126]